MTGYLHEPGDAKYWPNGILNAANSWSRSSGLQWLGEYNHNFVSTTQFVF